MSTILERTITNFGPRIDVITWTLTAISGIILGTRLYVRFTQSRLWWDDHLLIASWILLVAHASIATYAVQIGFGQHAVAVSDENLLTLVLLVSITGVVTLFAAACSKTSFAITLLKLTSGWLKVVVWAIIVSLNLVLLTNAILPFVRCIPIEAAWNPAAGGSCFDINITIHFSIFAAAYSALMDWLLALVPWAVIMALNMKTKEKIGVALCMSLGFVAGITSIVRCIKLPLLQSDDFTFRSGELAIWTVAEIATTIMATSIPVLRVFLQKMVTAHPGTTGGINPYRRSAVDGTFIKSLRSASKGTEHTTLITSGARDSTEANSFAQKSKDHRTIGFALEPDNYGKIMKVDTVAISYGHSRRNTEEDMDSSLADGSSNARSSIELTAMTRPVKDMPRNTGS